MAEPGATDGLTAQEYERLRQASETYREALVVRLGAEVGLRTAEMTRIRPADLTQRDYDGQTHHLLAVPDGSGGSRCAYVPEDLARDLRRYVNANDVDADEPIIDVTPRRVQMLVRAVAERAGDGQDALSDVSARDLRAHFATRLLVEEGIDPVVVRAVGGWKRLESLAPYLPEPTEEEIVTALSEAPTDDARPTRQPARHDPFVDCARTLGETLGDASTREEVEQLACETLTDVYRAAWVCDEHGEPRTWTGFDETTARETVWEAVRRTALLDERGVPDDATGVVQRTLDETRWGGDELAIVPLRSNETVHGLLCVLGDRGDTPDARRFLADVGRRIGWAIAAVERKRLLLADTGVELAFEITDGDSFFLGTSRDLDCRFDLEGLVPVQGQSLLYFVTVQGASVQALLDRAEASAAVSDARLIRDHGESAQVEFVVPGTTPATTLVEHGGTIQTHTVEAGVARLAGVFSNQVNVRAVVEDLTCRFPDAELLAKREAERPVRTEASIRRTMQRQLTEKQQSALQAAYFAGYFEWPRGSTAEELADSMGVSAPTLHNHLRKAQQKIFTAVFEESSPRDSPARRD